MRTSTITDFRSRIKERLREIEDDRDFLILSGPKKRDFVVLTLDLYNSMQETVHLMSTPANAKRLMESIAQDKAGNVTVRELDSGTKSSRPRRKFVAKKKIAMLVSFTHQGWEDYMYWQANDPDTLDKINELIKE